MSDIYKTHHFAATFDGNSPSESTLSIEADNLEALEDLITHNGLKREDATFYYRLTVEAHTSWGKLGDETDYQQLLAKLTRDFRYLGEKILTDTPITHTREVGYTEIRALEAQQDWDSDYTS